MICQFSNRITETTEPANLLNRQEDSFWEGRVQAVHATQIGQVKQLVQLSALEEIGQLCKGGYRQYHRENRLLQVRLGNQEFPNGLKQTLIKRHHLIGGFFI